MEIYSVIQSLLDKVIEAEMIANEDEIYARNQIMALLRLEGYSKPDKTLTDNGISDLLELLEKYATEKGLIKDLLHEREIFSSKVMDVFMPRPSNLNRIFFKYILF